MKVLPLFACAACALADPDVEHVEPVPHAGELGLYRVQQGESLFVAPSRPGLYPIFDRKSPDWWLYFLWPASDSAQQQTIERLESSRVGWALVVDEGIDGKDELRFRNSNAKVWEYLTRSFVDVGEKRLPPNHVLLQRRAP